MQEILIKTTELESLIFKIINFINKEETVNKYIFKNISNNINCEFDKEKSKINFYKNDYSKVNLSYLLNNRDENYLINYNKLKEFLCKNLHSNKNLKNIIDSLDYIYLDTLPNEEVDEIVSGNDIIELLYSLRIYNIDNINDFKILLVK